jgi:hypothetical protein
MRSSLSNVAIAVMVAMTMCKRRSIPRMCGCNTIAYGLDLD